MKVQLSYIGQFKWILRLWLYGFSFLCTSAVILRGRSHGESVTEIRDKPSVTVQLDSQGHRETLLEFTITAWARPLRITPVCIPAAYCKGAQNNLDTYGPVAFSMVSWCASQWLAQEWLLLIFFHFIQIQTAFLNPWTKPGRHLFVRFCLKSHVIFCFCLMSVLIHTDLWLSAVFGHAEECAALCFFVLFPCWLHKGSHKLTAISP